MGSPERAAAAAYADVSAFDDVVTAVERLLAVRGFALAGAPCHISGGANNRVYRATAGDREFLVKHYFAGGADMRDRFGTEQRFYDLLWMRGNRRIPEPIGWDSAQRIGVFEFLGGTRPQPLDVRAEHVEQALAFLRQINASGTRASATAITPASEACFSIDEHLHCVDRRVETLSSMTAATPMDADAADWVRRELGPAWVVVRRRAAEAAREAGLNCGEAIAHRERLLSPSDFGFHNAVVGTDGTVRFFDFEYAGWDDPAKTVCDFLCQPQVPVPVESYDGFREGVAALVGDASTCLVRAKLLLPVYRVKWCCIMLNEFVRTDYERRQFAVGEVDMQARKAFQLERAAQALTACGYSQ